VVEALAAHAPEGARAGAFARGARIGVRKTVIRLPAATRENAAPYLPSLSRIR